MVLITKSTSYEEVSLSGSFSFVSDLRKYEQWINTADEDSGRESRCSSEMSKCTQVNEQVRSKSPVGQWLTELRDTTQVESLSALQAKSVAVNEEAFEALSIRNAQVTIGRIRKESVEILDCLDLLIDQLPLTFEDLTFFKNDFAICSSRTYSLVETCRRRGCDTADYDGKKLSIEVFNSCQQLVKFVDDFISRRNVNNAQLEATLRKLKERLGELVNCTIRRDCQIIVSALRYPWGSICSKWALLALWSLTQNDAYLCRIFVDSFVVIQRLMRMACSGCGLVPQNNYQLKAAALRVLTYMSVNQQAVAQIFCEIEAGASIVNLLSWERNELVLKEAVGLLVQITLPFIDLKRPSKKKSAEPFSGVPVKELTKALTNLARSSCSRELFLLMAAALANISFMETDALVDNETCTVLVGASKQRLSLLRPGCSGNWSSSSLSLQGQQVSNQGGEEQRGQDARATAAGHPEALSAETSPETVAVERIQQKVAAALARLGSHRSCASLLHKLNGIQRLVQLCKEPQQRNFSDTVLLAALAALRRISATLGKSLFKQLGAVDLVELDLNDAFVLYSCKSESYV
ncbi:Protein inscuteable -like protein [Halotydeus destructor]|nr:Protein inscuteable -like protein [Halotydeus destructor]